VTESMIMTLGRDSLMMALVLGLPVLAACLLIGLVVSLFQAVTQINEMTLSFVPKLIGVGAVILILGPWMLEQIIRFTVRLMDLLPAMVR
jgi:flagellar biosynthetic protein FliQ